MLYQNSQLNPLNCEEDNGKTNLFFPVLSHLCKKAENLVSVVVATCKR